MVVAVLDIALAQFLADKSGLHGTDPLLADNGVFSGLESLGVVKVDAVEGGRDRRLLGLEDLGFGGRHGERCEECPL